MPAKRSSYHFPPGSDGQTKWWDDHSWLWTKLRHLFVPASSVYATLGLFSYYAFFFFQFNLTHKHNSGVFSNDKNIVSFLNIILFFSYFVDEDYATFFFPLTYMTISLVSDRMGWPSLFEWILSSIPLSAAVHCMAVTIHRYRWILDCIAWFHLHKNMFLSCRLTTSHTAYQYCKISIQLQFNVDVTTRIELHRY